MDAVQHQTLRWSLRNRRIGAIVATLLVGLLWVAGAYWVRITLGHPAIYSGATLMTCLVGLMLIGLRRRVPILPLWSVSTWVQIHLYTAVFACVAFVAHVPSIVANGKFEFGLSCLFLVVAASGFYGLFISRTGPKRLTALSTQPRYDQISWHRNQLAIAAHGAVNQLPETADRQVLQAYFDRSLQPYFDSPLSKRYLLLPTSARRHQLLAELAEHDRYLDPNVMAASKRLSALVRHRDDLDYQNAIQFRLRSWVVVHGAMSSVLFVWSIVHAGVALRMLGG